MLESVTVLTVIISLFFKETFSLLFTLRASKNNCNSSKAIQLMRPYLSWVFYRLCYIQFLRFKWSVKKHSILKVLLAIWEISLNENIVNFNSNRFSNKSPFIFFFFFPTNQKEESGLQQVGGRVTRNISVFCS